MTRFVVRLAVAPIGTGVYRLSGGFVRAEVAAALGAGIRPVYAFAADAGQAPRALPDPVHPWRVWQRGEVYRARDAKLGQAQAHVPRSMLVASPIIDGAIYGYARTPRRVWNRH
jgi:hypothetical protein